MQIYKCYCFRPAERKVFEPLVRVRITVFNKNNTYADILMHSRDGVLENT